jgi:hypothetical protein
MMNDFNGDLFDMAATPERAKWAEEQPGILPIWKKIRWKQTRQVIVTNLIWKRKIWMCVIIESLMEIFQRRKDVEYSCEVRR